MSDTTTRIRGVPVVERMLDRTEIRAVRPDHRLSGLDQFGDVDHQGRNEMSGDTATREMLVGTGEHIYAVLQLGDEYSTAEYVEAVTAAREAGVGEAYATKVLGVDVDLVVKGVVEDEGETTVRAAERRLRSRGVDPRKATYRQYADALAEVSA